MNELSDLMLYIPGPTFVSERVRQAAMLPGFGHRDVEAKKRIEPIQNNLREIMGVDDTYKILLIPGTGTNAMEAAVRSLVNDDETILVVSVGAFGDLFAEVAGSNKQNLCRYEIPPGDSIDLECLANVVGKYRPDVVAFTHNETSTGVMNDVSAVAKVVRDLGALPVVDGVSILGGAPTGIMEGDVAMYFGSTQKCLGLPAGYAIAAVSKDALEKAKLVGRKGYTTDITLHAKKADVGQTLTTTPAVLTNQLYVQTEYIVNEEGVDERFLRHERMRQMTHGWIDNLPQGFSLLPSPIDSSVSVTCIEVPEDFDRKAMKADMRELGYLCDTGYSKLSVPTIRIPHMGDITESMLEKYLDAVGQHIKENS